MTSISFGRQVTGDLDAAAAREWLVTDGLGGYAMGTVGGVRARRYHGLLVVATSPPGGRMVGLTALDPVLVVGDARIRLGTHEWVGGSTAPRGFEHLASFTLRDGVPSWRWSVGEIIVEAELAMACGRPAVGVRHRIVRAPGPVTLELEALCTWRDAHGSRSAGGDPDVERLEDGFVFERAYRVRGPAFDPAGAAWYRGEHHREETARGLDGEEDVWFAGRFVSRLEPGQAMDVEAWADDPFTPTAPAPLLIAAARRRTVELVTRCRPRDDAERLLVHAADQFLVTTPGGPTVVAGYPWFGDWSRDSMTSYEGLFLATNRADEGRALLTRMAATMSEGMLANTADAGGLEYNTVDATPWFLHAVARHVEVTGDLSLVADVADAVLAVFDHHVAGTRFGIRADDDGLLTQGADGWALTWMDARVDGVPITPRAGKPVEVNALWISGLTRLAMFLDHAGVYRAAEIATLAGRARRSFRTRFVRADGGGLLDVVDPDDPSVRPNQLLAVSLPDAPIDDQATAVAVVRACGPLLTSIGLRSLTPESDHYIGRHRGGPAERDGAYHQGTVWPWLIGPYLDACGVAGVPTDGVLDGVLAHVREFGLGSVSETADGDVPHGATGCPFQAWSVAEVLRAKRAGRN